MVCKITNLLLFSIIHLKHVLFWSCDSKDFDVEISLDYVLDYAEVVDHETKTREVYDGCWKTIKNQITLTRHKKTYQETKELVNIDTVKNIVYECFNDAITDKCLDNTTWEHIEQCDKRCLNSALFEECASLYEKLLQTGNAEKFYASFYSNIVANAVDKFPGMLFPSCTTIAIKIVDKLLAYSGKDCTQSQKHNKKGLSSREVDAIQYLAGYIIKNLLQKATRGNPDAKIIETLMSFIDANYSSQTLVAAKRWLDCC